MAQRPIIAKMSPMVRQIAMRQAASPGLMKAPAASSRGFLSAFVRITGNGDSILGSVGGDVQARYGDIYIARVPLGRISELSRLRAVQRIEADAPCSLTLDTLAHCINAAKAYAATALPQAFTGNGVVVGVEDIGFDLTHPTFYEPATGECRIKAMWDQLSTDESTLAVGADYVGSDAVAAYAHSRDGLDQTHGTHTTGIAAGNGGDSPYRGVAYEADICLVANATTENAALIAEEDQYKYTSATDALGFKYIFDYAQRQGKPCVVSFSEGSYDGFYDEKMLYRQVLDSLVGPGRILVASAGNEGLVKSYFLKPAGVASAGCFISPSEGRVLFTLKGKSAFGVRLTAYGNTTTVYERSVSDILACKDSLLVDSLQWGNIMIEAYPSAVDRNELVMEVYVADMSATALSAEATGSESEVGFYRGRGTLTTNSLNPLLTAGEATHNVLMPGSAPAAICVGATSYRTDIYTYLGDHRSYNMGTQGTRAYYSSVGPAWDETTKPDVMAPGTNVVSAYSSYYIENHPAAWDVLNSDKEHFSHNGRTYAWNYNSGTSMSTPAAAGAIALWLQARPSLSPTEVKALLATTSRRPDATLDYPNSLYGYGEIDVYRGLLQLLGLTSVADLSTAQPRSVAIRPTSEGVEITFAAPTAKDFTLAVYSVQGQRVYQERVGGGQSMYRLPLGQLPHGVYAVQVTTGEKSTTGSQLIRY